MFSYVSLEQRVPQDHPLRAVRKLTDQVLAVVERGVRQAVCGLGPSLDRAGVYSAGAVVAGVLLDPFGAAVGRADRLQPAVSLVRRPGHGRRGVEPRGVFQEPRSAAEQREVAQQFFAAVNRQAKRFMSDEHFTVDGTLIQAWASQKSFRAKDGSDDGDGANFHGQKRSNQTHASTTDTTPGCTRRATARSRS